MPGDMELLDVEGELKPYRLLGESVTDLGYVGES